MTWNSDVSLESEAAEAAEAEDGASVPPPPARPAVSRRAVGLVDSTSAMDSAVAANAVDADAAKVCADPRTQAAVARPRSR